MGVSPELACLPIKSVKTVLIGPDPEGPGSVFKNGLNFIVAQAFRVVRIISMMNEFIRSPIQPVQPVVGSNPEGSGSIFVYGLDLIVAQALRIGRIV